MWMLVPVGEGAWATHRPGTCPRPALAAGGRRPTSTRTASAAASASRQLGVPVVVENKPGVGGTLGASAMVGNGNYVVKVKDPWRFLNAMDAFRESVRLPQLKRLHWLV